MPDSSAHAAAAPGQTADRVGYFTDAVFAIAMTLLVIEIPRPQASTFDVGDGTSKTKAFTNLWHFLVAQDSAFIAYALAFFILWIVWRGHHVLFDQVSRVSRPMIALHFPLLLLVAFLPYPTTVIGHYPDNPLAALLFTLVVGGLLLCRSLIQRRADLDDVLLPEVDRDKFRASVSLSFIVTGYWAATLAVVWWTPWVLIPWFLTSPAAHLIQRVMANRSGADTQHDAAK